VFGEPQARVGGKRVNPHIERLLEIVRPPLGGGDDVNWDEFQEEFGFTLPSDFREFMGLYGGGVLGGWFGTVALNDPEEPYEEWRYQFESPLDLWHYGESGNQFAEESPYPVDPGVGTLVFCAVGGPGQHVRLFWNATSEDPEAWTMVAVCPTGIDQDEDIAEAPLGDFVAAGWTWQEFQTGFAEFLVDVLDGRVDNPLCTDPAFEASHDFVHAEDLAELAHYRISFLDMVLSPQETVATLRENGRDPVTFFASSADL
jgi:hypothetical protein